MLPRGFPSTSGECTVQLLSRISFEPQYLIEKEMASATHLLCPSKAFLPDAPFFFSHLFYQHSSHHAFLTMVTFRGLAWPNRIAVNRLERSDLSQTTPSPPAEIETPSVQDLVVQLEAKQEESRRRSSVGDRPSTPNFRIQPSRPVIPYSPILSPNPASWLSPVPKELVTVQEEASRGVRARSTSPDLEHKEVPLVFTTAEGETIYHPHSLIPTLPVREEDMDWI
ncbi:hypothetical protein BKA65DRAFT_123327 [Rhexocercosporidium sp. MPI-PUGE-AT-0058]|nr:hypothetical protein BKA65DRAFT_123327 [Rhexocercosporidium sp. MPI-PUGE-AT-0058]